jgi:ABC-type transport system substrate-binding protein
MLKRQLRAAGLLLAALVLVACQPGAVEVPVTVVVRETQPPVVQTQVVNQTQVVEVEVPVEVEQGAFTRPHPIVSDLRVRQAIAYCTDKEELLASVYPLLSEEQRAIRRRAPCCWTKPAGP